MKKILLLVFFMSFIFIPPLLGNDFEGQTEITKTEITKTPNIQATEVLLPDIKLKSQNALKKSLVLEPSFYIEVLCLKPKNILSLNKERARSIYIYKTKINKLPDISNSLINCFLPSRQI